MDVKEDVSHGVTCYTPDNLSNTKAVTLTTKYTVGVVSTTLTNTTTVTGGSGTSTNPYTVTPGTKITVSADCTTCSPSNTGKKFAFNTSTTYSTTNTHTVVSSAVANTTYSVYAKAKAEYGGNLSKTAVQSGTIYYKCVPNTYSVTIKRNPAEGGDVTIGGTSNPSTAQIGSTSVSINATPKTGYQFKNWTTSNSNITVKNSTSSSTYVTATGTGTLTANFEKIPCTVTYTLGNNVTYSTSSGGTHNSTSKTITADYGDTVSLTVDYAPGYEYDPDNSIIPSGATVSTDKKTFTFSSIKADKSITINAKQSAQTKSLKYYVDLHSNTPSSTSPPTIKFSGGSAVTLTREGTSTVYSADVPTPYSPDTKQVVNPATITFNGHIYDVSIGDKDINDIKEVWIESRGTLDSTTTDKFKVMSYASYESTFTVTGGTFNDISTKLYGSEGSGDLDNVINGCGIITKNEDGSYTVKYAVEDADTEYGELKLRVSFTTTANDDYYFDGWYVDGAKSDDYKSADAEIWLDGKNYELSYVEKTTWNVKVVYHYDVYDNSKVKYYDEEQAKEDKPMTYTVKGLTFKGDSIDDVMSESDLRENIEHNAPNLVNDYYQYALIPVPDTTDPDYGYSVDYDKNSLTCTITAHLKKTVRMYTVTLDGEKYGKGDYSYQAPITIQSGEVSEVGNTQSLIWLDDGREVATGSSYSFRVTGNMTITTKPNESGDTFDGRSIIAHRSYELNTALETNQLIQNFYIADFYNVSNYGLESEFVGGGVLYYAVKDDENGAPTKAKDVVNSENGEADTKKLEDVVKRVAEDNYGSPDSNSIIQATDTNTNVVCRYVPYKDHHDVFKFSDSLQAYQYIYSANMKNSSDNGKYSLRVYSYFVYYDSDDPGDGYVISVSDNYADAKMYMAQ